MACDTQKNISIRANGLTQSHRNTLRQRYTHTPRYYKLYPPFFFNHDGINSKTLPHVGGGALWARERGTICPLGVFPNLGGNPCSEASCGVVTFSHVLKAFQVALGSWSPEFTICPFRARIWPFQAPKTQRFKGKMANFETKNTIQQGKKRQKDKWYPFHACTGGAFFFIFQEKNAHMNIFRVGSSDGDLPGVSLCRDRKNHDSHGFKKVQWRRRPKIADFCPLSWSNMP